MEMNGISGTHGRSRAPATLTQASSVPGVRPRQNRYGTRALMAGRYRYRSAAVGRSGRNQPPPCSRATSGTISSATMLMILMSGFTAGPAVSL